MDQEEARPPLTGEARLAAYLDAIAGVLGHARRAAAARAYCTGLLLPGERKSIEPMAARLDPTHVQAKHQALHHVMAQAAWDDAAVLAAVRVQVLPAIERHGPVLDGIVDDTNFPKQGTHSVGVARQDCGQLGKQDNCQVAVSLSAANDQASLPIAYRLFLPEAWANDPLRRAKAGFRPRSALRARPRSRSNSCVRRWRMACRWGSSWGIQPMAMRPHSASASPRWAYAICLACGRAPASGHPATGRCRRRPGPVADAQPPDCAAMPRIGR
jgi:DDE superfamily endonuclease